VHRRQIVPVLVLALSFVVAACGSAGPTSTAGSGPTGAASSATSTSSDRSPASSEAPASPTASQGEAPSEPAPSAAPTEAATDSPEAAATPDASIADACTGTDDNRMFFVGAARAVDWPVLCAVLANRWFVSTGTYRLANGGKLQIGYKGPGGATLSLAEGAFCQGADGCVPTGTDVKATKLGSLDGTLVALDDGGYAIVVDRGKNPSWLLEAHGITQAATVRLGKAVAEVAD